MLKSKLFVGSIVSVEPETVILGLVATSNVSNTLSFESYLITIFPIPF